MLAQRVERLFAHAHIAGIPSGSAGAPWVQRRRQDLPQKMDLAWLDDRGHILRDASVAGQGVKMTAERAAQADAPNAQRTDGRKAGERTAAKT